MGIINQILEIFGLWGLLDLIGAFFVVVGCLGELWILLNKLTQEAVPIGKNPNAFWRCIVKLDSWCRPFLLKLKIRGRKISEAKEHLLERAFVFLLSIGVATELVALPFGLLEVAELKVQVAESEKLSLELSKQVESLKSENLKLFERIQPRRVTPEQKEEIRKRLIPWMYDEDRCNLQVFVAAIDPEARVFAEQIIDAMPRQFSGVVNEESRTPPKIGFGTKFTTHSAPSASMRAIARALAILPINPVSVEIDTAVPEGTLQIDVLAKPME